MPSTTFGDGAEIHGEVQHQPGSEVGNLTIELSDPVRHSRPFSAVVMNSGEFEFIGVPFGTYTLRVLSLSGAIVAEKLVEVEESVSRLEVELPVPTGAKPGTGTISVAQLMHRVPSAAVKDYQHALRAIQKKNASEGIDLLEKAIAIDPEFSEAQADLGRLYILQHNAEKAQIAFSAVLKLNPRSEVVYAGLSVSQFWLNHYPEAERFARRALEINPGSDATNLFLGLSLAAQTKDDEEAIQHLDKCAGRFPIARVTAAQILARRKNLSAAAAELKDYLNSGDTQRRREVTAWLQQLDQAPKLESARK